MKKLIISGDSLTMPRIEDGVFYEDTYPYLLQVALGSEWHVVNRSRRANTSKKQAIPLHLSDDIHDFRPDIFIYHLGIVDCAPRLFSEFNQKFLDKTPDLVRSGIIKFFSRRRVYMTRNFPKVFVKKENFREYVLKTMEVVKQYTHNIYVVGIGMPGQKVLNRSHGFKKNVLEYNDVLRELCMDMGVQYIDTVALLNTETDLLNDGYHFSKEANTRIFEALYRQISSLIDRPST